MANLVKEVNQELKTWFAGILTSLEEEPDFIDAMSLEEVDRQLKQMGIDGDRFCAEMAKRLAAARLKNAMGTLISWISPVWQPKWAGVPVCASDIPQQSYSFPLEDGSIEITCRWEDHYQKRPAFIKFSWKARVSGKQHFWVRFLNPETQEIRYETCLGPYPSGEEKFSSQELGFNPAHEVWAVSVYTTEVEEGA